MTCPGDPPGKKGPGSLLHRAQSIHTNFLGKLQKCFYRLGFKIGSNPVIFLLLSLSISIISYGAVHVRFAQRLQDGFVSKESLARVEHSIKTQFDGEENIEVQRFVVLIRRTDGGNLLEQKYLKRVKELSSFIDNNTTVTVDDVSYRHSQLCGKYCHGNDLLWAFMKVAEGVYENDDVFVDHPQSRYHEHSFLIAHHLFGITRKTDDVPNVESAQLGKSVFIPYNSEHTWPVESNRTALKSATLISLYFQAPAPDKNVTNILTKWETEVFEWSQNHLEFEEFRVDVMGDKILGLEMVRGGMSLLPYLIAGIVTTVVFVTAMVMYSAARNKRKDLGCVVIVIGIIISPLLAVSTTFGVMGLFGVEIYPIHMVIPFLILAIGVDDAFLMNHSWDRILPEYRSMEGGRGSGITALIFARVLEDVGPSITITSLTNAMAFAIGTTVSSPAMQSFCFAATVAISLDFLLEVTLFGSLLVIAGRMYKGPTDILEKKESRNGLVARYSKLLTKNSTRVLVMGGTSIFFLLSLYGTLRIETQIDSQKIIPHNSSLLSADLLFKDYYWKEYEPIQIFVNNPPDISNATALEELKAMVKDFESMDRSIGPKSTMLWLNDYEKAYQDIYSFYAFLGGNFPLSYDELPHFLIETRAGAVWNQTIKWHKDPSGKVVVDQFAFYTGTHNGTTWMQRAENMLRWRKVAAQWSQFNVTVYNENSAVFEGIFGLAGQTTLTAVLTLLSMIVVCVFFVPSVVGVICAALAIASISLGVLGFLSLTGLDLDPVTMSAIVMSIGFSVDYTAHISYHYQRSWTVLPRTCTAADCVEYTISSVGWPMLEAALSTLVCFFPVMLHPDYTPTVFVRTIVFVVLFGIFHGLLILPTVLAMIPRSFFIFDSSRPNLQYVQHQPLPLLIEVKGSAPEPHLQLPSDDLSASSANETTVSFLTNTESCAE